MKKIIIAIDGHSSCGKSTLAKALARVLQYGYIDTGAMYRATTLFFIQNEVDYQDPNAVETALQQIQITFQAGEHGNETILNGTVVEDEIRKMYVSQQVSPVATISAVRRAMVRQQQEMGKSKGVILDGRDIGTVVFPDAELKIFLTAEPAIRAQRRYDELLAKGQNPDFQEVLQNLQERDYIDSNRADSPLKKAEDAIVIDNTFLTPDEQLAQALALANRVIEQL